MLRFVGVWDNTKSFGGDRQVYAINYYVADDTIEVLEPLRRSEGYTIIGGDAVIDANGRAVLLELNFYPNLWDLNEVTNTEVKQPLLRDVVTVVLFGAQPEDFERFDQGSKSTARKTLDECG